MEKKKEHVPPTALQLHYSREDAATIAFLNRSNMDLINAMVESLVCSTHKLHAKVIDVKEFDKEVSDTLDQKY